MLRKAMSAAILSLTLLSASGQADTLLIEGIETDNSQRPQRGLTKEAVASSFGEPVKQSSAVGDPPISSWEYDGYVVFFEHDKVLHTVTKR